MPVASNLHWEQIPITPFPTKTKTADVSGCWWIIVDYHFEPKGTKCGFCSSTCKPLKNWFALPQAWEPPQFLSGSRHWHWTSTWTALFEKGYNKTTCQNTCKQKNTTLFHLFLNHSSKKKEKKSLTCRRGRAEERQVKPQVTEPSEEKHTTAAPSTTCHLCPATIIEAHSPAVGLVTRGQTFNRNYYPTLCSALSVNTNMIIKSIHIN